MKKYVKKSDIWKDHELWCKARNCIGLTYRFKMNKELIINLVCDMFGGRREELEQMSLVLIFMKYYNDGLDEDLLIESMDGHRFANFNKKDIKFVIEKSALDSAKDLRDCLDCEGILDEINKKRLDIIESELKRLKKIDDVLPLDIRDIDDLERFIKRVVNSEEKRNEQ